MGGTWSQIGEAITIKTKSCLWKAIVVNLQPNSNPSEKRKGNAHEILLSLFCVRSIWRYLLPLNVQPRILRTRIMVLLETLQSAALSISPSWVAVIMSSACICASMISNTLGVSLRRPLLLGSRDSVPRALYFGTVVQTVFLGTLSPSAPELWPISHRIASVQSKAARSTACNKTTWLFSLLFDRDHARTEDTYHCTFINMTLWH